MFRFEWKRSLTVPRLAWWAILTAFPPALLGLIRIAEGPPPADAPEVPAIVVYVLCPCVVCMMGVFLWATPAITAELEGLSWVYLAVRPHGAVSVLIGKYLVAVTWTLPAALIASSLSLLILDAQELGHLLLVEWGLIVLSCLAYAAAFMLIGVLFTKRTMVIGVFYALFFEVFMSLIPAAVVNTLTIQFRLRCLFVRWMDWDVSKVIDIDNPAFLAYFGDESAMWHLTLLLAMTAGLLIAAGLILRLREFTSSADADL